MSIRAKLFHTALKYRHLAKGKLRPDIITKECSIERLRAETDAAAKRLIKPIPGITYEPVETGIVYAEWVKSVQSPTDRAVLYFHGGGFVMGSAHAHRSIVGNLIKHLNVNALVFDYRLAPEHPAPAAVEDATAVYLWLLKQGYAAEQIAFAGDSAGGGIALATLLKLKDDGRPLPSACAVFSPCTDMTMQGASHQTRAAKDPCTPKGANATYMRYYVGAGDPQHPYASPLFGSLSGLPPIKIQVGDNETLRDDSVQFYEKARAAGVEVELRVWKGMFHCFPLMAPLFPEASTALTESCAFLRAQLKIKP